MDDIYILGAGGTSRELIDLIDDINHDGPRWNLCGLLDDDPDVSNREINGVPVIGPISLASHRKGFFVSGIASFANRYVRKKVIARLGLGTERYGSLIHPSARISRWAQIGVGTIIQQDVVVGPQVRLGDHVIASAMCFIGHDAVLSDFVTLAPQVCIAGGAKIGECAYLGAGARIRETVDVGAGALVGIGSVVIADIKSGNTVFGNPARTAQADHRSQN